MQAFGRVYVFSGADGSIARQYNGEAAGDHFGWAVVSAGDLNGDTLADFLIGAPGAGPGGEGRVYARSSADVFAGPIGGGPVLHVWTGDAAGDRFGEAIAGGVDLPNLAVDVTRDGVPDIFIGAPGANGGTGRAYIYDGRTFARRLTLTGEAAGDQFGAAVAISSREYLLVGAPGVDSPVAGPLGGQDVGGVYTFTATGQGGVARRTGERAGDAVGSSITNLGDLVHTGSDTFAASSPGATVSSRVRFLDSATLFRITTPNVAALNGGAAVYAAGDINNDGISDLLSVAADRSRATLYTVFAVTNGPPIHHASDNGRFLWNEVHFVDVTAAALPVWVIDDGLVTVGERIAGLGHAVVQAMNNSGLIMGADLVISGGYYLPGAKFFLANGVKTYLSDAITSVVGAPMPNLASLALVKLGNNGDSIYKQTGVYYADTWLLHGGTLTYLWRGDVSDINSSGVVLGTRVPVGQTIGTTVVRATSGAVTALAGFYDGANISDSGVVAGQVGTSLAIWQNGHATILGSVPRSPGAMDVQWMPIDIDSAGRVLARYTEYFNPGNGQQPVAYMYDSIGGLNLVTSLLFNVGAGGTVALQILDGNRVLAWQGFYQPDNTPGATLRAGSAVSSASAGGAIYAAGVNQYGEGVIIRSGVAWDARPLTISVAPGQPAPVITDVKIYADPHDGRVYAAAIVGGRLLWFAPNAGGFYPGGIDLATAGRTAIVDKLTVFTSSDGRVHLAGVNAAGEMVLYAQNNTAAPSSLANWSYTNISTEQLTPHGLATPVFTGALAAMVTPWNGLVIVGLDGAGHVHAVWTAPGLGGWSVDDLSASSGAPALHGSLSAFTTGWGAMDVAGIDENGDTALVWWVPQFGTGWAYNVLAPGSGRRLDPDSLTTFVTPWNGLQIVGRDANTGKVTTYWWTPTTNEWRVSIMFTGAEPAGVSMTGRLDSKVTGTMLAVFGRRDNGHLMRLAWKPGDGEVWTPVDVTELA